MLLHVESFIYTGMAASQSSWSSDASLALGQQHPPGTFGFELGPIGKIVGSQDRGNKRGI
jgi:hypothetical protein